MNTVLDFVRAAAPWIAAGLAVIIIAVRGVRKKKKGEKENSEANYSLEEMSLGMCIGLSEQCSVTTMSASAFRSGCSSALSSEALF